jgi:ferredoxin
VDLSVRGVNYGHTKIEPSDLVLIAMPTIGGLAPQAALDRLSKIRGKGARCALLGVYGNRAYEDTLVQMEDAAKACGFKVIAAVAAVAEHSVARHIAAGRPNAEDRAVLAEFGKEILAKAEKGDDTPPAIPGNRPYRNPVGMSLVPKGTADCAGCGICAKDCPVGAIHQMSLKTADKSVCISCMRCVAHCPRHARKLGSLVLSLAGFLLKGAASEPKKNELFI